MISKTMTTEMQILPDELVMSKIYVIRNVKVMLDSDLAELYEVETKQLKRAVKRNVKRFPDDFMFELTEIEFANLRSQFGTSSWGGVRYAPMAFTEQGVAMLSSVLSSERAVMVNIQIILIFTKMRALLSTHKEILQKLEQIEKKDIEQDDKIGLIFEYLKQLEQTKQQELEQKNRPKIGFKLQVAVVQGKFDPFFRQKPNITRKEIEEKTGKKVITKQNAKQIVQKKSNKIE